MCKNHKISKFGDFILENKVAKLLLEGNLMASERFLKKLSTIKENPIASTLYKAFSDRQLINKDLSQNWVDTTDKDDAVTFMSDRGAARIDPGLGLELFSAKGRNEIKVGRLARAILGELGQKVQDKEIETFVNTYKASKEDNTQKLELVSGPMIKKYYLHSNYAESVGTLGGSCMRYENCQSYFKIYTKNPENCQLLVYLNEEGKVLGRAIVWKLYKKELYNKDQTTFECPAEYFMDRVYVSKDSDQIKFVNYAKEKGWIYKWKMSADDLESLAFKYGDHSVFGRLTVKLNRCIFRKYPFFDTLSFCDGDTLISNIGFTKDEKDDDAENGFMMVSTEGESDECDSCDGTGWDEYNDSNCQRCGGDGSVNCPECRGRGEEICLKCDGDGDIECKTCNGNGSYDCNKCNGNGEIKCAFCSGEGFKKCEVCRGKGDLGPCDVCKGNGEYDCPKCKGEDVVCVVCVGKGRISKKWGTGTRNVTCPGCDGEGKGTSGVKKHKGCVCDDCVDYNYDGSWSNSGEIQCKKCDGNGDIPCAACDGKDGMFSPGQIECEHCDGNGEKDCDACEHGQIECKKCDGNGKLGQCKNCKGKGTLGPCKNVECHDGRVKCIRCKGSGDRPKGEGKALCGECSGLLDKFREDLESCEIKLK
jgi:hypothetical protein